MNLFWTWLAKYVRASSSILLKTILAALFRTFGLPLRLCPSKPPFLHDHFTTQHSDFPSSFSSYYNR